MSDTKGMAARRSRRESAPEMRPGLAVAALTCCP